MASLKNRIGQSIKNLHDRIQYNLCKVFYNYQSWSSIIGVETRLWNGHLRNNSTIPSRGKRFSFPQGIQTHPASHSIYIRGSSPVDQSLPSQANNKALNYTATLSCHHSTVFKLINVTSPFVVTGLKIMFLQVT